MRPERTHVAGTTSTPEPPALLLAALDHLTHPLVAQSGVTSTADGRWAVFVTVPAATAVPVAAIEKQAGGFPVVYGAAPGEPPVAWPAAPPRPGK